MDSFLLSTAKGLVVPPGQTALYRDAGGNLRVRKGGINGTDTTIGDTTAIATSLAAATGDQVARATDVYDALQDVAGVVTPRIIHVASNGNDTTGDGSLAEPFLTGTAGYAAAVALGGGVRMLRFGVGTFTISLTANWNSAVHLSGAGVLASLLTINGDGTANGASGKNVEVVIGDGLFLSISSSGFGGANGPEEGIVGQNGGAGGTITVTCVGNSRIEVGAGGGNGGNATGAAAGGGGNGGTVTITNAKHVLAVTVAGGYTGNGGDPATAGVINLKRCAHVENVTTSGSGGLVNLIDCNITGAIQVGGGSPGLVAMSGCSFTSLATGNFDDYNILGSASGGSPSSNRITPSI